MGNCQAADVAATVVECPDGRIMRMMAIQGHPILARRLMANHPDYFVALLSSSVVQSSSSVSFRVISQEKSPAEFRAQGFNSSSFRLIAPDAPLLSGHRYRLISFEEVMTCFSHMNKNCDNFPRSMIRENERNRAVIMRQNLGEERPNTVSNHVFYIGCGGSRHDTNTV
ncbi:hypothetical protein KP509_24G013200 [Ceratopteris richardii]|uniref:Uncharacterized protein n=1 Tax=Ceratopteris richardii TaxID=49495 RepID=A0A8T2RSJ8_CERRI|nr:hypothetical protein KP509_24G013200 [Ceratopteris richardii]